ncbi:hypothetical protein BURPS1710b_2957 [Burkholderia pseudomallei 1710b]|uniref:Uncharacterized protein n=1 Tax=Burkholderia pseudomallei (strain 1710b) TaxID=320372 RepID=Q3JQ17_BURP1|nr:hypothetical protein BURPS1710b_2957 [Burkholderia pseudomallei 1710b]
MAEPAGEQRIERADAPEEREADKHRRGDDDLEHREPRALDRVVGGALVRGERDRFAELRGHAGAMRGDEADLPRREPQLGARHRDDRDGEEQGEGIGGHRRRWWVSMRELYVLADPARLLFAGPPGGARAVRSFPRIAHDRYLRRGRPARARSQRTEPRLARHGNDGPGPGHRPHHRDRRRRHQFDPRHRGRGAGARDPSERRDACEDGRLEQEHPWPLGPHRPRARVERHRGGRRRADRGVSRRARAARQVADVRKFDLPGPPLHGALDARARTLLSLPQPRREHAQGAVPALAARDLQGFPEARDAYRARRYPRVDRRAQVLPRAFSDSGRAGGRDRVSGRRAPRGLARSGAHACVCPRRHAVRRRGGRRRAAQTRRFAREARRDAGRGRRGACRRPGVPASAARPFLRFPLECGHRRDSRRGHARRAPRHLGARTALFGRNATHTAGFVCAYGPPIRSMQYGTAAKMPGTSTLPSAPRSPSSVSLIDFGWPGRFTISAA